MLKRLLLTPLALAGLTFLVCGGLALYLIQLDAQRFRIQVRTQMSQRVADARAALERGLNARLNLLYALEGMVLALPRIDDQTFQNIAGRMGEAFPAVREIELAPDAVIRFVYPAGDPDRLIGLDLRTLPGQRAMLDATIASGRMTLVGPMHLVQGGVGFVVRYPIYTGAGRTRRFWGLASVVFDFAKFIQYYPELAPGDVEFALRTTEAGAGAPFYGTPQVFADAPVLANVVYPNGHWQLAARPRGGWQVAPEYHAWVLAVAGLGAFLAALATYILRARVLATRRIAGLRRQTDLLEESVAEKSRQLQTILDTAGVGITFVQDRHPVWSNPRAAEMFGYSTEEMARMEGRQFYASEEDYQLIGHDAYQAMAEGSLFRSEVRMRRKDGGVLWVRMSGRAVRPGDPARGAIWVLEDITAVKEYQRALEHDVGHDVLTGLPTRALLVDRLRQLLQQSKRRQQSLMVAFIDLDGFKLINDRYGHAIGDRFLIELAARMKAALREGDTLARQGGDEFLALLVGLTAENGHDQLLARLLDAAAAPVRIDGHELSVTASIGVVEYPACEADAEGLIRYADQAMYAAKSAGKNRYVLYRPRP